MADPKWEVVVAKCNKDIEAARTAIEAPGVTERDADLERGKIAQARAILKLGEAKPEFATTSYA